MSLDSRLIGPEIYFFRIVEILDHCILNVNGNVDQNRSFSSGIRNVKSFSEYSGNIIYILDQIAVFYKGFHSTGNISFLKHIASQKFAVYLPRNADQGDAVCKGGGNTGDHIGCPRAGSHSADPGSAGHPRHTAGSMSRILLRADQYSFNIGIQNTVEKRTYGDSGVPEDSAYSFFFQTFNNCICSNHVRPLLYLYYYEITFIPLSFWPVLQHLPHPWNSRPLRSLPHIPE